MVKTDDAGVNVRLEKARHEQSPARDDVAAALVLACWCARRGRRHRGAPADAIARSSAETSSAAPGSIGRSTGKRWARVRKLALLARAGYRCRSSPASLAGSRCDHVIPLPVAPRNGDPFSLDRRAASPDPRSCHISRKRPPRIGSRTRNATHGANWSLLI